MKTLRDCQDRVAKRFGLKDWGSAKHKGWSYGALYFQQAAELYGRYCRMIGRMQLRQERFAQENEERIARGIPPIIYRK